MPHSERVRVIVMEFNEKIQELRKRKGLTQEELAEALYVSRTAVSKWESGRGYPNIDSLKAIAKFFSVTVDDLLSGEEMLTIAEEDNRQKENHLRDLVFGLLDCSTVMFFFLPFFGQGLDGMVQEVSLLALTELTPYLKAAYYVIAIEMTVLGVLTLALQNCHSSFGERSRKQVSLISGTIGVLLFTVSQQPYAAVFLFVFLAIKVLMLIKWK